MPSQDFAIDVLAHLRRPGRSTSTWARGMVRLTMISTAVGQQGIDLHGCEPELLGAFLCGLGLHVRERHDVQHVKTMHRLEVGGGEIIRAR